MELEEAMIVKTNIALPDWQGALYKQKNLRLCLLGMLPLEKKKDVSSGFRIFERSRFKNLRN